MLTWTWCNCNCVVLCCGYVCCRTVYSLNRHSTGKYLMYEHVFFLCYCWCIGVNVVCGFVSESDISLFIYMLLIRFKRLLGTAVSFWFIFRCAVRTSHSNETNSIENLTCGHPRYKILWSCIVKFKFSSSWMVV